MIRRPLLALMVAAAVAACSGLGRPDPPPVIALTTITADPADARCRAIGAKSRQDIRPAPFTIDTLALGLPVAVTCERAAFQSTTEMLYARPRPPLASALAAGALLSPMANDAPPTGVLPDSPVPAALTVSLRPALFSTPTARDRYYSRLRSERLSRWETFAQRVDAECAAHAGLPPTASGPGPIICTAARNALTQQRDTDLRRLEIDRRQSTFQ
jgi:hypothetical protein